MFFKCLWLFLKSVVPILKCLNIPTVILTLICLKILVTAKINFSWDINNHEFKINEALLYVRDLLLKAHILNETFISIFFEC